jgi:2-(1,2-epoxy-1,2-dihydrophenyl)acetyl-CoA isomerase
VGAFILTDISERIGTITLNRPDKLNAYTTEMGDEITATLRAWRDDLAVRAVIVTGAGRGFCAGVDLEHLKAHQAGENASKGPRLGDEDFLKKLPLELSEYPKPLIAAVNGAAIGVGVTMILPCDIRIAADTARLGFAFVKLGILPGGAQEAAACGLVNAVVPASELLAEARELAALIAANPPHAVAAAKAALNYGHAHSMSEAMQNEEHASTELREKQPAGTFFK